MATEKIEIIVSERGSVSVKRNLEDIGRTGRTAGDGVGFLQSALAGLAGVIGIAQLTRLADTYTTISNRIGLVTDSATEAANVQDRLFNIAMETRQAYDATVSSFQQTAMAAGDLGISLSTVLDYQELLNKAVVIGGSSAQAASAGIYQLGQGLSEGALRGDELVSVMGNLPYVAKLIAEEMNAPIGSLRDLAAQGLITSDVVIRAMTNAATEINATFASMDATIGQAWQVLNTALIEFIGSGSETFGIASLIADAIILLANNLDIAAMAITPLIVGLGILAGQAAIGAVVSGVTALTSGVLYLGQAFMTLQALLLANPWILLATAVAAVLVRLVMLGDEATGFYALLRNLILGGWDIWKSTWGQMFDFFVTVMDWVIEKFTGTADFFRTYLEQIAAWFKSTFQGIADFFNGLMDLINGRLDATASKAAKVAGEAGAARLAAARTGGGVDVAGRSGGGTTVTGGGGGSSDGNPAPWTKDGYGNTMQNGVQVIKGPGRAYEHGGSFRVGGQGGPDSQLVQFMATPNERVTVQTPTQQKNDSGGNTAVSLQAINIIDPKTLINALHTAHGKRVLYNVIKSDPRTFRRALGGA